MWSTVACLIVVLVAFDSTSAFDRAKAKEKVTEFRIRSQNLHIDDVEKQLDKLEQEFDALSAPVSKEDTVHLKARVRKLEGKQCPHKEVSCGGDWPECVHNLLVCDGIKDCHNGRDEDEAICDGSIVRVGSTFRGLVHWSGYVSNGDHEYSVTITVARRSPFFATRTYVRAAITRELEDHTVLSIPAKGYYAFGARSLILTPEDSANAHFPFVTICSFFSGDNDRADCKIKTLVTLEKVGLAKIQRV